MSRQHKASRRQSMRSALAHRRAADELLDSLHDLQKKWNASMAKLDADTAVALDTDYEASGKITDVFESDASALPAQHKSTIRKTMRSALAHRRLADEICDALEELHVAYNAILVKLDAQGGTLTDTDWVSSLGIQKMEIDKSEAGAQHKASLRKSARSALSHRRLADEFLDALVAAQDNMNQSLAALDAGNVNGAHAAFTLSELDPDK